MNTKKLGIGFAIVLFAVVLCMPFSIAWAGNSPEAPALVGVGGSLYDGGFMNEVLTHRNPTPWKIVRHYVGNKPKIIVMILKEQGISLDLAVKYPVGTVVRIPQVYVLKALLPSPSSAEAAVQKAELKGELMRSERKLEMKDNEITGHWVFHVLSALMIAVLIGFLMNTYSKYINTNDTATTLRARLSEASERGNRLYAGNIDLKTKFVEAEQRYQKYVDLVNGDKAMLAKQLAEMHGLLDAIVFNQVGQTKSFIDNNGERHGCLIKRHEWDLQNKVSVVWLQCAYCDTETHDKREDVLKHISRSHPGKMNPDPNPKMKVVDNLAHHGPAGELE